MRFKDLIDRLEDFDGELIINGYESEFSFVWDNTTRLTEEGEQQFKNIINSDFKISKGNIIITNEAILEEDIEIFLASCAGHISKKIYDDWFENVEEKEK